MSAPLRLGVLVDSEAKLSLLKTAVGQTGQKIEYCALVPSVDDDKQTEVPILSLDDLDRISGLDAWLVDIIHAEDDAGYVPGAPILNALLSASQPVILNDSSELGSTPADRLAWIRKIKSRLQRLIGEVNLQHQQAAPEVWILAASTGGPAAVCNFLQALEPNLGLGFLYVQHINEGYSPTLMNMVSRAGEYPAVMGEQGSVIQANTVTLVDPMQRVEVQENSTLILHDEPWGGCYQPSIDQLAANLARSHRNRCGMIVFSGMGEDGSASCRFIKQQGGAVWAQALDDCVVDSMPTAAIATDCVEFSAKPNELAQALAQRLHKQEPFTEEPFAHESSAIHRI
ncbi:chemotaxis protein CheB [Gilvimarinus agarilyticus]|uniref:chemotaxis protein CheB n=1 Tax=unclassified Gilvimarinus TaxID=2642066 RepID=UPI001C09D4F6|nr:MULTISPECIES: chemotaxis protein CheB [unclassified Gilvimarinus]MBU2884427.1 chemotaxis protein CheB [Gilvimarinus agarilyticus]MDO6569563.1 chemotaxis protein CheB [Gilvimarinus sp. 2_MG-2023]MDO6748112.1 chemotaxis protein CheB [Gilvimarinus sp. 1_MG-2023]